MLPLRLLRVAGAFCSGAILLMAGPARGQAPAEAKPNSAAAERAARELAAWAPTWSEPSKGFPPFASSIDDLAGADIGRRAEAADYLTSLLAGLLARELRDGDGRVRWWDQVNTSPAGDLRKLIAQRLAEKTAGDEALAPAVWLLEHDLASAPQRFALQVVAQTKTPKADALLEKLLATVHPHAGVLEGAIEEATRRKLPIGPALRVLAQSYRSRIREAARAAARELGLGELAEYRPSEAFTPRITTLFDQTEEMLAEKIPPDARWVRVTTHPPADHPRRVSGFLLEEKPEYSLVLDWEGDRLLVTAGHPDDPPIPRERYGTWLADSSTEPATMADEWEFIKALREKEPAEAAIEWGMTGTFETPFITAREMLMALWSYHRGDKELAASLLFPRLDQTEDDRWMPQGVRDTFGTSLHLAMVEEFYNRNYLSTLRYARRLAAPVFAGYEYHGRAQELAADLPTRMDDFATFTLPSPAEWTRIKAGLGRPGRIRYLAERLRLLNCVQHGQPGSVDYGDPQFATVEEREQWEEDSRSPVPRVINPFNELLRLAITPGEAPLLFPWLEERRYLPSYGFWRSFTSGRDMDRVCDLAALVFNHVVQQPWIAPREFELLDEPGRQALFGRLQTWARENSRLTATDYLLKTLRSDEEFLNLSFMAMDAVRWKAPAALPLIARHIAASHWLWDGTQAARVCLELPSPELRQVARGWIRQKERDPRWFGARALLRCGSTAEQRQAVRVLAPRARDDPFEFGQIFDDLLASRETSARALALEILTDPKTLAERSNMVTALLLKGHEEALQFLLRALADSSPGQAGSLSGKDEQGDFRWTPTTRADKAGDLIEYWRHGPNGYGRLTVDVREAMRAEQRRWLLAQWALIKAGKPSAIPAPGPFDQSVWLERL